MSTKSTLKFETDESGGGLFHLYREMFDEEETFVYLNLVGVPFETATGDLSGNGQPSVTVRIPEEWARKLGLVEGATAIPTP